MADEVLLLLCRICPPTVLYWPLKLTPPVRCTTIVIVSAVIGLVLASFTSSSSNHGPLAATTGVTVGPPPAVGVGVGVAVAVGVGVGVPVGVGVGVGVLVAVGVGVGPPNLA